MYPALNRVQNPQLSEDHQELSGSRQRDIQAATIREKANAISADRGEENNLALTSLHRISGSDGDAERLRSQQSWDTIPLRRVESYDADLMSLQFTNRDEARC
jgi:hypothetical protein